MCLSVGGVGGVGGVGVVSGRVEAVSERCRLTLVSTVSEVSGLCLIGVRWARRGGRCGRLPGRLTRRAFAAEETRKTREARTSSESRSSKSSGGEQPTEAVNKAAWAQKRLYTSRLRRMARLEDRREASGPSVDRASACVFVSPRPEVVRSLRF